MYKQLTRKYNNISNQKHQQSLLFNSTPILNTIINKTENSTKPYSYANVTRDYQSFKLNPTPINNSEIALIKFLHEFKSI